MNHPDAPWGEPLHRYTRAEAVAERVLVDVTGEATAEMLGGFAVPIAITEALHHAIQAIPLALVAIAYMRERLHDGLWMAIVAVRHQDAKLFLAPRNLASWHIEQYAHHSEAAATKVPGCQVVGPWGGNLAREVLERFQVMLPHRGTRKRAQTLDLAVDGGNDGRPCATIGFPEHS